MKKAQVKTSINESVLKSDNDQITSEIKIDNKIIDKFIPSPGNDKLFISEEKPVNTFIKEKETRHYPSPGNDQLFVSEEPKVKEEITSFTPIAGNQKLFKPDVICEKEQEMKNSASNGQAPIHTCTTNSELEKNKFVYSEETLKINNNDYENLNNTYKIQGLKICKDKIKKPCYDCYEDDYPKKKKIKIN